MFTRIAFTGVALMGLLLSCAQTPVLPAFTRSIVPIRAPIVVDGEQPIFCTAFVIDAKRHYLMTADHCMGVPFFPEVEGEPAMEVFHIPEMDIAIIEAPGVKDRKAMKPRLTAAKWDEYVASFGYANGKEEIRILRMKVVFPQMTLPSAQGAYLVTNKRHISGMSGGPIMDSGGKVVGVVQAYIENANLGMGRSMLSVYEATKDWWQAEETK